MLVVAELPVGPRNVDAFCFRYLSRAAPQSNLYGDDALTRTQVDHWLGFTIGQLSADLSEALKLLETSVKPGSFLVNGKISAADYAVYGGLFASGEWQALLQGKGAKGSVLEWYKFIGDLPEVKAVVSGLPKDAIPKATAKPTPKKKGGEGKPGGGGGAAPKQQQGSNSQEKSCLEKYLEITYTILGTRGKMNVVYPCHRIKIEISIQLFPCEFSPGQGKGRGQVR